jgi:hypothetical protein
MKNPRLFLNKDEIFILLDIISDYKYEYNEANYFKGKDLFFALEKLEMKLAKMSKNNKRTGRTSQNDYTDKIKRFIANNKEVQNEA